MSSSPEARQPSGSSLDSAIGEGSLGDGAKKGALLRSLPSIDSLLTQPSLEHLLADQPRPRKVAVLRRAVERARHRLLGGEERGLDEEDVVEALKEVSTPGLRRVLNGTGVVLHTNLGRAPLAGPAANRVLEIASGYSNLEYDVEEGERGSRYTPLVGLLAELTGAEAAVVVNNNAAAVLLTLAAIAEGGEVIVSRGELVEIGGGFRIPDVMRQSGARIVEVGTTNRTRLSDYEAAISPQTRLLLKVHKSNFAIVGFTEEVSASELASLGQRASLPVFEDLGSGALVAFEDLEGEPIVSQAVASGVDLLSFSGDKLLGGPQAGVILGKSAWVKKIAAHPLNRAVRVDKMTVAALEATLELYRDGRLEQIPVQRLLRQSAAELRARAERLRLLLQAGGVEATVERSSGQVGGGAMPSATPTSYACALVPHSPLKFQEKLRRADPPLITRVTGDRILIDVRCLEDGELELVARIVTAKA